MQDWTPAASFRENLRYNLTYAIPLALQGSFTRRRFWVALFSRLQRDPGAVSFYQGLRRKYDSQYIYLRVLTTRTLLVMHPDGVRRVLERSPLVYADSRSKRDGMRIFQPEAVAISRGRVWKHRRGFNDRVLDYGSPLHRHADFILHTVRSEVAGVAGAGRLWTWDQFDDLFARIARQVVLGARARDDDGVTHMLRALMRRANLPFWPRTRLLRRFQRRINLYLAASSNQDQSLVGVCVGTPHDDLTRVSHQIPHWLFAAWETVAANAVRALALIAAHPQAEQRIREEMASVDLTAPAGVDALKRLEACILEAMRLWPTTPLIVRELIDDDRLNGAPLPYGTQVMISNSLLNRDSETDPALDRFTPERWEAKHARCAFHHFGAGPQACAGRDLALFLAKSVLAYLLAGASYSLESPVTLRPGEPMPRSFNYFNVRLAAAAPVA